ncbi:MAG: hypothetical protein HQ568_01680 [Calditrichaeota bacterium]|nr:hypothetical protein [Calditrichota bacterium]
MSRKRKRNKETCYFCGAEASSREHVPPKCIFDTSKPHNNLITVPSCDEHNSGLSEDDEYLKWFLLTSAADDSLINSRQFEAMIRGINERPKLLASLMQKRKYINIKTVSGIDLGFKPGFVIDWTRVNRIFDKIIKGLFYHHVSNEEQGKFEVNEVQLSLSIDGLNYGLNINEEMKRGFSMLPLNTIQNGVFSYKFISNPKCKMESYWMQRFFESIFAFTSTSQIEQNSQ